MRYVSFVLLFLIVCGCSSSSIDELIDAVEDPDRKSLDRSVLGINAFANDQRFGSIAAQLQEVRSTLKLRFVRVLFAWNDQVQPTPSSAPNFSFYDDVLAALPADTDALVVLTGRPSWMRDPANWTAGNPRRTFAERWVAVAARRYAADPQVVGFQVWNEPNNEAFLENETMAVTVSPENYVELLSFSENQIRSQAPGKLVVGAATTAINQNFPDSIDYNRRARDAGALGLVDRWAIHFYGKQLENVVRDGGVEDFVDGLGKGVWVTESGAQGVNNQLAYGETIWPYLREKMPAIERIYIYQFTEDSPSASSYGLRTLDPAFPVSDLYVKLANTP